MLALDCDGVRRGQLATRAQGALVRAYLVHVSRIAARGASSHFENLTSNIKNASPRNVIGMPAAGNDACTP